MEKLENEGLIRNNHTMLNHYIVAVGASAGGLEAIHEFFDNMPANSNFSFILIQHLSPDYKSLLVELVSKHTHMKVFEAEDKMTVQKECIYVIPNNKLMTIYNGKLRLTEKVQDKQPNTAIDHFLNSLAQEKKDKAIAIILSGTGSDGTKGIEAIKSCGGMVVVQDPVTAKFDGMPNSAIASGNADLILPPEMIPEEIFNHIKENPVLVLNKGKIDDGLLDEIFNLIHSAHGYDFHYYKTPTIIRRIGKRMGLHNVRRLEDYVAILRQNGEEVKNLGKDFLIGVTRFFRDQAAFDALYQQVLPDLINEKSDGDSLKVWICACSTGEEAYSLAILIDQYLIKFRRMLDVKIFATDIDENSVEYAAKNQYPLSVEKDLNPEILAKYFVKEGKHYSVLPRIRKQIVFARHNVIKDPPFIKNDLVSCRNMLIYMNSVLQQKVLNTLHFSLQTGGYLFLGTSETVGAIKDSLDEVNSKWKIYRKIGKNRLSPFDVYRQLDTREAPKVTPAFSRLGKKKNSQLIEDLTETIIDDFGYACFYIDKNYEIKESVGDFNRFLSLPEKKLNLNILKMVPQELSVALNTAIRKSWKEEKRVFLKSVRIKQGESDLFLSISIRPAEPLSGKPYTLIVLGENSLSQISIREDSKHYSSDEHSEYVSELEAELNEARTNLQLAVEGLETTNEELQSSNEELLSANEELQSSNEELQSLNEELHTLNTEHQLKIRELIELNDDLNNYLRSTGIGQIFIDKDQRIRKFNSAAIKLVNLIESDVGRPISHISTNIRYENLMRDIALVIDSQEAIEKEIILNDEGRFLMRIMPYIRQDQKTDGAIISFVDISAITNLNNIITGVFNSSLSSIMAFKAVRTYSGQIEDFVLETCNYASDELLGGVSANHNGKYLREIEAFSGSNLFHKCIEVVEKGTPLHAEVSMRNKWFEVVAVKMMDGFVATFNDITQKREAEQRLRNNYNELILARENLKKLNIELEDKVEERTRELSVSEERFRLVSKATNDAIWDWNLVNNSIWWSDSFRSLFGYETPECTTDVDFWFSKIHPNDRTRIKDSIYAVINGASSQWFEEYQFCKQDGTYAYVLDRGYLLLDEYGTPYRMLGSKLDISELKKAQEQILKSESRFRKVFDSNMIGMLFTNKEGVIINANEAFLHMTGYSHEDLKSGTITWKEITPPEFFERNLLAAEQIWSSGVCPPFEGEYFRKDGSRINVLLGAAAVSEDDAVAVTYIIDITERKEAERKEIELQQIIKRQQDEFRGIFMNAPALISIRRGEELNVEFVNQTLRDYFGRKNHEGNNDIDLLDDYSLEGGGSAEIMRGVFNSGVPFFGKAFHLKFDKERNGKLEDVWFDFVYQPVYNNAGIVDGVATFAFDVSDMIRANEALKKSEGRFRFLAETVPQKVWTATPDGAGNYFNQGWLDYTGKSLDELVGMGWMDVVHPDDRKQNLELWWKAVNSGEPFEMERRLQRADGSYRWHLSRSIPQKDEDGNIIMWVATSTDINDQRNATEALKQSEDYFRQLADQSPFMIWKVDEKGKCNYVNKKWITFTGITFENSLGDGWRSAFHYDDAEKENKKFTKAFNSREIYQSKFRIKSARSEYHWVLVQANPVTGNGFEGYIGSLTDITEQELAQQATKLLMQKKDEFMSIASHELKTPITSMKASLQIAERLSTRKVEAEKIQTFIEKANKQVNRLTSLVEDLLDVTKIQAGKMQFESVRFDIDEVVRSSMEQMQNESMKHEILITGDSHVPVLGDIHRLEQVITNFLSNAIKYSPDADKVLVNIKRESQQVKVFVTDYGIGIPEDKINFVFDRFFRVQESSQKFSGLGLGLFISAEIIKRHNGDVGVYSEEGKGSTFWFTLPVAD